MTALRASVDMTAEEWNRPLYLAWRYFGTRRSGTELTSEYTFREPGSGDPVRVWLRTRWTSATAVEVDVNFDGHGAADWRPIVSAEMTPLASAPLSDCTQETWRAVLEARSQVGAIVALDLAVERQQVLPVDDNAAAELVALARRDDRAAFDALAGCLMPVGMITGCWYGVRKMLGEDRS